MKKVKIMLTAITIFAVVGGALAFKAKSFQGGDVFTSNGQPGAQACTVLSTQLKFDDNTPEDQVRGTIISPTCSAELPVDIVQ